MKTVFLLGAGASKDAGAPLMADFLDKAHQLYESNKIVDRAAFEDVFEGASELQNVFAKSYLEMGLLIKKFAQRDPESIRRLRNSIITVIVQTLESSVLFPVRDGHIYPARPYETLMNVIVEQRQRQQLLPGTTLSFISFNYDLALDYALSHYGSLQFDYCLGNAEANSLRIPYLKLHGSLNWGYCSQCKLVIPFEFQEFSRNKHFQLIGIDHLTFKLGSEISQKQHCGKPLQGPPILIPPTWNKTGYHQDLTNVWQRASAVLESAEDVFVIGYSLPQMDSFFQYFFALGAAGRGRMRRFWVFNPDEDNTVRPRFDSIVGPGLKNGYQFFKKTLKEAIPIIYEVLKSA